MGGVAKVVYPPPILSSRPRLRCPREVEVIHRNRARCLKKEQWHRSASCITPRRGFRRQALVFSGCSSSRAHPLDTLSRSASYAPGGA